MAGQILTYAALPARRGPEGPYRPGVPGRPGGPEDALASAAAAWRLAAGAAGRGISPEAALSLAEPRAGRSGAEIAWHTPLAGPAREIAALSGRARVDAEKAASRRASELAALAARLSGSPDPSAKAAAKALSRFASALAAGAAG
ncbi:MAG: hypothetical protein LBQ12_14780, partial [Deltaproteobacteria bacterium]|nr:hypothetical protein [Deltaproteobacteria bacterium]